MAQQRDQHLRDHNATTNAQSSLSALQNTYGFSADGSFGSGHHLRPTTYPPDPSFAPLLTPGSSRSVSFDKRRNIETASFLAQEPVLKKREEGISRRRRDWKVWPIYVREAAERDKDREEGWDGDMDVLLIFAGLFSAVVTAFLVQEYQQLQPSYAELTAQLLYARYSTLNDSQTMDVSNFNPPNYQPSPQGSDVVVNLLWFAALTFSVAAALLAMLGKIWIRQISSNLASVPYDRARQRQFRWNGIRRFKLAAVLNSLTLLLHISAFLFFAGLLVFLSNLNQATIFPVITTLFAITVTAYVGMTMLPLISPDAPFKIPLINVLGSLTVWSGKKSGRDNIRTRELKRIDKMKGVVDAQAIAWLLETSETLATKDALDASMEIIADVLSGTAEERNAMFKAGVLSILYRLFLDADDDEDDPREIVQILTAIKLLWHDSDSKEGLKLRRKAGPNDDLHNSFFVTLVEVLENSTNTEILDAAIQLPKQFSGWPIAEWPIASRVSVPKMMRQLDHGMFNSPESKEAALNVVVRVFSLMRSTQTSRHVNEQDLISSIPVIADIIQSDESPQIIRSALQVLEEIDGALYRAAPEGWAQDHKDLYLNSAHGLLKALLSLLSRSDSLEDKTHIRVRYLLCRLICHEKIGDACRDWIAEHGGVPVIVADIRGYVAPTAAPADLHVLLLIDSMTAGGFLRGHADTFIDAGLLDALTEYFRRDRPPYEAAIWSGLLRRLLRLANEGGTPEPARMRADRVKESQVLEAILDRLPVRLAQSYQRADIELADTARLARIYVQSGSLPPGQVPPVQPRGRMPPPQLPLPQLPPLVRVSSESSE